MKVGRVGRARVAPLLDALRADELKVVEGGLWLGATEGERLVGVVHLLERDGIHLIDDLWVSPSERTQGIAGALIAAAKARRRPLWLICDEDQIGFYDRRGFVKVAAEEFPEALYQHYESKGEWPHDVDHAHTAMRWE